jgi:hypothetical protein
MSDISWKLTCDKASFDKFKSAPTYGHILAVARAVNVLRFVHGAWRSDGPYSNRDRVNVFLFACSVLWEGFKLLEKMERSKLFDKSLAFVDELKKLKDDPTAYKIRHGHMKKVRNWATFHFDPKEFKRIGRRSPSHECSFAVGQGDEGIYYEFGDAVVLDMFVGSIGGVDPRYDAKAKVAIEGVRELVIRFAGAADSFLGEQLKGMGFKYKS